MTDKHPITPPPHLIEQWWQDHSTKYALARQAAQWGADQANADIERQRQEAADRELDACRMEIIDGAGLFYIDETSERVRLAEDIWTARRPKPPSLKEEALEELDTIAAVFRMSHGGDLVCDKIRRALESISDPS